MRILSGARRFRVRWTVGVVAFIAGLLFATSASVFAGEDDTTARSLGALVEEESERLAERNAQVEQLRADVAALEAALDVAPQPASPAVALAVGLEPVAGPGLTVTLDDAPASSTSTNPDDLVVHQQDLQAVVNAMWAGGAEAVSVQGERVIATTAIRCVGNVLLLGGRTYSPPYRVEAIGDVGDLTDALEADATIDRYLDYVAAYKLGWKVEESDSLELTAYTGTRTLNHAAVFQEDL